MSSIRGEGHWYRSIDDQSITTQKTFIDWYRLAEKTRTDVTHATFPIIRHSWEALGTKLVKNSDPVSQRKEYTPLKYHWPVIAFPCHCVYTSPGRGFLNIRCLVKVYHLCRFEVNVGEVSSADKKRGERGNAFKVINHRGQLGHLQSGYLQTGR